MTATIDTDTILGSRKFIVSLYAGHERVGRIIFRDCERELAEQCLVEAAAIDTLSEWDVIAFCNLWHARRAEAEDVRGGGKREYRARRVWHADVE